MFSQLTNPARNLYIVDQPKSFILLRMKGSAGLPPSEVDGLACPNKRLNKKSIVFGGIEFQILSLY